MKKTYLFKSVKLVLLFLLLTSFVSRVEAAIEYKVKKGDNFYTIAKKHNVKIDDLKNLNTISAKNIKPGDKLIIPLQKKEADKKTKSVDSKKESVSHKKTPKENVTDGPKMYTVKKGDNVWSIARRFHIDAEELMEINEMDSPSLKAGQKLYLEEEQPIIAEFQNNKMLTKNLEEELKNVSESDEFSAKSLPEKLSLFARKLLNIPYKFGGNSILGIDCSAYVKKVYGLLGTDLPRTAREQFNEGETIDKEELSIGDLVFFRTYASFPSHVGIYLGNNLFIHASSKGKKVKVDNLDAPYFMKRFIGAKRLLSDENKSTEPQS
ncbi:MAG: hypothetical protein CVV37_03145 [Nitrospira bacterium HGW-Nitrospira-1]|nr:MAG: hypothetical protein CVV37_03145 [Nitrospira bacterium HGW-Nitrospira-1]